MKTRTLLGIIASALLLMAGCGESIGSGSVKTDGVYADLYASADGSGQTLVHAGLKTGGPNSNTFLTLETGDELVYHADGKTYTPNTKDVLDQFEVYEKNVPVEKGGTKIRVEFKRQSGTSAPNSTTTLPNKFDIMKPKNKPEFSRANDDVEIAISNGQQGTLQSVTITGKCIKSPIRKEFTGKSITIPSGSIKEVEADDGSQGEVKKCTANVTVRRRMDGSVDSAYSSGVFYGIQKRKASFTTKP